MQRVRHLEGRQARVSAHRREDFVEHDLVYPAASAVSKSKLFTVSSCASLPAGYVLRAGAVRAGQPNREIT